MSIVTDISKQQKTVALSILLTNLKSNLNEPSIQVSLFKFICYGKKIIARHDFTRPIIKWSLIIFENFTSMPRFFFIVHTCSNTYSYWSGSQNQKRILYHDLHKSVLCTPRTIFYWAQFTGRSHNKNVPKKSTVVFDNLFHLFQLCVWKTFIINSDF